MYYHKWIILGFVETLLVWKVGDGLRVQPLVQRGHSYNPQIRSLSEGTLNERDGRDWSWTQNSGTFRSLQETLEAILRAERRGKQDL
jgi:hypothetical protein